MIIGLSGALRREQLQDYKEFFLTATLNIEGLKMLLVAAKEAGNNYLEFTLL
jgi:hypothetical protein